MASKSEYDTFDYLKPADYLPGLKQRYAEMNQGFEDAEQVAKLNDRQRVANAEIMGRVIKNAESFSKSAAKAFKKQRDEAQRVYKNEAFGIQQKIGASQSDMAAWKRDREALGEDHSTAQYLAYKATEAGHADLAAELQNLTGWRAQIQEETFAKRWANDWEGNFWDPEKGILSKNENGEYNYSITLKGDDGQPDRVVSWENATQAEKGQLIEHYNVQTGFNGVSHYRKEFATDTFWTKHQNNVNKVLQGERDKALEVQAKERVDFYKSTIIEAAKTGNGDLAKTLYEIENNELAWFKGDRSAARLQLMEMVKQMIIDGDIDPSDATLEGFTFLHKGENTEKGLDFFKEYDEGWGDMVRDALITKRQEQNKEVQGYNINFVETTKSQLEEENLPLNEQTLTQLQEQYRQGYYAKFGEFPTTIPPDLLNMVTVEDVADQEIVSILEDKKARGLPITYQDYAHIEDDKLRKTWADYSKTAAGEGISDQAKEYRDKRVNPLVQEVLNTSLGHYDHKNLEHIDMIAKATARFNELYIDKVDEYKPGDPALMTDIMKTLESDIKAWTQLPPPAPTEKTWAKDLHKGKTALNNGLKEGVSARETLSSDLLAGSEKYYKELEKYANDPGNSSIPSYYREIANDLNLTAWEVANMQYRSQTGKDLPKPGHQTHIESLSPIVRYWMTTHPNGKKALRAKVKEKNMDYNTVGITEGVVTEETAPVLDSNFWGN